MALLGSISFNAVFYITLIPVSIFIFILYFFLSTKKLQAFGGLWIRFVLTTLRLFCGITWVVEGKENIPKNPWTGNIDKMFTRAVFINLSFY